MAFSIWFLFAETDGLDACVAQQYQLARSAADINVLTS